MVGCLQNYPSPLESYFYDWTCQHNAELYEIMPIATNPSHSLRGEIFPHHGPLSDAIRCDAAESSNAKVSQPTSKSSRRKTAYLQELCPSWRRRTRRQTLLYRFKGEGHPTSDPDSDAGNPLRLDGSRRHRNCLHRVRCVQISKAQHL